MDAETRKLLRAAVDEAARARAATGYLDCDPESLTRRASEADDAGYPEIAGALRRFRDRVVNPLLGEGWTVARIELALAQWGRTRREGTG